MLDSLETLIQRGLRTLIVFTPWVAALYTLYWIDYGQIWTSETAHRGKMSVAILVLGMGLSFLIQSRFAKRD